MKDFSHMLRLLRFVTENVTAFCKRFQQLAGSVTFVTGLRGTTHARARTRTCIFLFTVTTVTERYNKAFQCVTCYAQVLRRNTLHSCAGRKAFLNFSGGFYG